MGRKSNDYPGIEVLQPARPMASALRAAGLKRATQRPLRHRGLVPIMPRRDYLELRAVPRMAITGTLPERIVYRELVRRNVQFSFQSSLDGGRLVLGGLVVDFLIYGCGGAPIALRVQGAYWHQGMGAFDKDFLQQKRLEEFGFVVVDIWEWECYNRQVLEDRLDRWHIWS